MEQAFVQILGIRFFNGDADSAVETMQGNGGFLVAPSGTCFARLREDSAYREAMTRADLALPDSGAMVLLWQLFHRERLSRISGMKYLQRLCAKLFAGNPQTLWVVPNDKALEKTVAWLAQNRMVPKSEDLYVAPIYEKDVKDRQLLSCIESARPQHIVIGIGSGPQEKLGFFLRENLSYRPAIHCIGAALGFLTGEQVAIPEWGDRFYLGWLFRLVAQPRIFIPRLSRAVELPWLIFRFGRDLPTLRR